MKTVNCKFLHKELEALTYPPYPGEFGRLLIENISKEAWQSWLKHQTMLINENQISALDIGARKYLREQCERYLIIRRSR